MIAQPQVIVVTTLRQFARKHPPNYAQCLRYISPIHVSAGHAIIVQNSIVELYALLWEPRVTGRAMRYGFFVSTKGHWTDQHLAVRHGQGIVS